MAENYVVVPLDPETAGELAALGVPHPPPRPITRGPWPAEVFAALTQFVDLDRHVSRNAGRQWVIVQVASRETAGRHSEVQLFGVTAEDAPCRLSFRGGSFRLVREITSAVAQRCGPLVIYPASGADPVVCTGATPDAEPGAAADGGA